MRDTARRSRAAAHELRVMTREEKDRALVAMANALEADADVIVRRTRSIRLAPARTERRRL